MNKLFLFFNIAFFSLYIYRYIEIRKKMNESFSKHFNMPTAFLDPNALANS